MKYNDKVLIVGPLPPPMGGIATYVDDLLKSNLNKEYTILHLNTTRSLIIKKSLIKNFTLFYINSIKLVYLLLLYKPKIVHIHTSSYLAFWEKSFFLIISKLFAKKTILHIHGGGFKDFYQTRGVNVRALIRFLLNLSDIVIVLSNTWKEFFVQIVEPDKVNVIYNAVNSNFYNINKTTNQLNSSSVQILFAGYLSKDKGIYDILDSVPLLIKKHKNVKFVFAGAEDTPGELEIIKKRIIKNNIGNYVSFLGVLPKRGLISLYENSDIFILPSYIEGMPMTILEAMASGLPVISTPVGGISEVIIDGINGFLITPGDYVDLANKITMLVENNELCKTMSVNNRKKIKKDYSWDITSMKISSIYSLLLK